jgi:outer membrane protein W
MRRLFFPFGLAVLVTALTPAAAHAQQSFNFYIGAFGPRAEDARVLDDVLVQDRTFLDFNINHFASATVGAEWLVQLGDKAEAGLGVGFYQHTELAPDIEGRVIDTTGAPIAADLKLRIVPFSATLRYLPMGHGSFEPYIGAGVGVFAWRYSETGDFVATDGSTVVHGNFVGSGSAVGPVILAGARFPFGPASIGGEIRYQSAKGNLPGDQGFAGSRIDLGGFNYLLTFNVRF